MDLLSMSSHSPIASWKVCGGRVDLYRENDSFSGFVTKSKSGKIQPIDSHSIKGLPNLSQFDTSQTSNKYFLDTFAKIASLSNGSFSLSIHQRGRGGMFKRGDALEFFNREGRPPEEQLVVDPYRNFRVVSLNPPALSQKMEERGDGRFKILSIDGGGTRGIIPLKILRALERYIGPASETFDLMAGTSTGGLITLGLTCPNSSHSADDILRIYQNRAGDIFRPNSYRHVHNLAAKVIGLTPVMREYMASVLTNYPIYTSSGIEELSAELMGESLMKDARTNILIPALDITSTQSYTSFFDNRSPDFAFLSMRDIGCATAAAPMYFPNKFIGGRRYLDGGLACNNPALECHLYAMHHGISAASQCILSLGTGFADIDGIGGAKERHNLLYWAKTIFPAVGATLANTINHNLYNALENRYWRIDPHLNEEIPLDSYSPEAIQQLDHIGEALVEEKHDIIREIAYELRPDCR